MEALGVVLFIAVLAGFLVHRRRHAVRLRRLARHGVVTQATVLRREQRRSPKGIPRPYLVYRFVTEDGRPLERRAAVTQAEYRRAAPGSAITVVYDRHRPDLSRTRDYLVRSGYLQV